MPTRAPLHCSEQPEGLESRPTRVSMVMRSSSSGAAQRDFVKDFDVLAPKNSEFRAAVVTHGTREAQVLSLAAVAQDLVGIIKNATVADRRTTTRSDSAARPRPPTTTAAARRSQDEGHSSSDLPRTMYILPRYRVLHDIEYCRGWGWWRSLPPRGAQLSPPTPWRGAETASPDGQYAQPALSTVCGSQTHFLLLAQHRCRLDHRTADGSQKCAPWHACSAAGARSGCVGCRSGGGRIAFPHAS